MQIRGRNIHLVGAKGTGMAALAEILAARGASLTGSDVAESFPTDEILDRLQLRPGVGFAAGDLPAGTDWVIHSAAYERSGNPQLLAAAARGIPLSSYPEALGALSRTARSVAIAGVHGKTTTAALCGLLVQALHLPATVLTATGVANFDGRATLIGGADYLIAETCEYRNHFASFRPSHVVITAVELEHVDAFPTHAALVAAFTDFAGTLPEGGTLVYCADNAGAAEVARIVSERRPDLRLLPYGEHAAGALRISSLREAAGVTRFRLHCLAEPVALQVPGRHNAANAAAAAGVACVLLGEQGRALGESQQSAIVRALGAYRGGKRRTEIVGECGGILVIDDYAHHPTELVTTLAGLRAFYPGRRIVVDFMSHTFSRTAALLADFATAFGAADEVLLHPVYASAREQSPVTPEQAGRALYDAVAGEHPRVRWCGTLAAASERLAATLRRGDLLVTMGAGDNWRVGREVLRLLGGARQRGAEC
ncbi:MAG: UDP-N-acetylmuramate--L-alanine ligase [Spirochaetaceae bacterium]|nr:UDP-N-acetylmuramate--L-alanine ligase [Spirochaetaceae bacterium]